MTPTRQEARRHVRETGHQMGSIPALSGPTETAYACLDCPWPLEPTNDAPA